MKDFEKYQSSRANDFKREINFKKDYWIVTGIKVGIVGFGQARLNKLINDEGYAEIEKIYIKKEFRRNGIAKKIANELIKWLKKRGITVVGSRIYYKNKASIKLNEFLGFKLMTVRMEKLITSAELEEYLEVRVAGQVYFIDTDTVADISLGKVNRPSVCL